MHLSALPLFVVRCLKTSELGKRGFIARGFLVTVPVGVMSHVPGQMDFCQEVLYLVNLTCSGADPLLAKASHNSQPSYLSCQLSISESVQCWTRDAYAHRDYK
jgi:hypothetical protein